MPWLLWCFDRQLHARRELVIIDSSPEPYQPAGREDVRVVPAPPGTSVAVKRNLALQEARGEIITWFDDDDWQHPEKLTRLVAALNGGAPLAGATDGWFVDLLTERSAPHQAPRGHIIFNSAGFRREAVLPFRFPPHARKASDSRWLLDLTSRYRQRMVVLRQQVLSFWLCHQDNLSNPSKSKRFSPPLTDLKSLLGTDAWGDTDEAMASLRRRLNGDGQTTSNATAIGRVIMNGATAHLNGAAHFGGRVSACLLSWKRQHHMQAIVDSLHGLDFIDEILVWNNNAQTPLNLRGERVRVITSEKNLLCYGRFAYARLARNEIVYVQDDDVLVRNVPDLYRQFLADDTCITHALSQQHFRLRDRYVYPEAHLALLGWGAFFRKDWLGVLDPWAESHGDDPLFLREADKYFALLLSRRHNTLLGRLDHFSDSNTPGLALWRDPDHGLLKSLAVRQALAALRASKRVRFPVTWNVVIPCHNYGRFLQEAVQSVLLNDADYTIRLVDGASTDNTAEVCDQLTQAHTHISCIKLSERSGVSHARNLGIAAVDSLFVVLLDADDRIGPNYLYEAEKRLRAGADVVNPDPCCSATAAPVGPSRRPHPCRCSCGGTPSTTAPPSGAASGAKGEASTSKSRGGRTTSSGSGSPRPGPGFRKLPVIISTTDGTAPHAPKTRRRSKIKYCPTFDKSTVMSIRVSRRVPAFRQRWSGAVPLCHPLRTGLIT
jgi:glycosyltransferase involved in cell wall biosynthesis